ncbi:fumarylacetoacetase [Flindersiella endophytica]
MPVPEGSPFPLQNLPYGVFSLPDESPRVGVALGDYVIDLAPLAAGGEWAHFASVFSAPTLNPFLAYGRPAWTDTRAWLIGRLTDEGARSLVEPWLIPRSSVRMHLPFDVADFVDFYASEQHATNLGRMFRPHEEPLNPNWKHLPVGYHGRAGTVSVSGTPVHRPCGQRIAPGESLPSYGPSLRLDLEAEVGFVVGAPSSPGRPVSVSAFRDHVFGVVLVNDWTARDIQGWEYRPLGPFLGKSFLTSISPWVVPLDALSAALLPVPAQDPEPLPYLRGVGNFGLDLSLEVSLNGEVISRPQYGGMYWTPPQLLAHLTANGAALRTGDLLASGTVSGASREEYGSLIELSWSGKDPLPLADGTMRSFLEDGDELVITATAPADADGTRLGFGEVAGSIRPAFDI